MSRRSGVASAPWAGAVAGPLALVVASLLGVAGAADARVAVEDVERLLSLSLEELGQIEVTVAGLNAGALATVPASVYVLDREQILASGARTLPEALSLVPNLHVARSDARGASIAARGLKTSLSNKMLVLVDGRPVYTPLFSGVLWDQQMVLLEDVERIEVVSGPGAAAWGTNAVNGVISIITRPAGDTVGTLLAAHAGASRHGFAARHGFDLGATGAARVFARRGVFSSTETADGSDVGDGWTQELAGFRADWGDDVDRFMLDGGAFRGDAAPQPPPGAVSTEGHFLVGRWQRLLDVGGHVELRGFYDVVDRTDRLVMSDRMRLFDLEARHVLTQGRHALTWGAGYRHAEDDSEAGGFLGLIPASRDLEWLSLFVQDTIALDEALALDLGLRAERNDYTGFEWLPSVRLSWQASERSVWWANAARAVRAPARFDRELFFPITAPILMGGPGFESEVSKVLEFGWRGRVGEHAGVSLTAFHHWHEGLRAGVLDNGSFVLGNGVDAEVWGIEGWATLRLPAQWELAAGFIELRQSRTLRPGFSGNDSLRDQGNDPEHQLMLRFTRNLSHGQQLFLYARHVSALPDPFVPSYTVLDARWSWQATPRVRLGVGVDNLLDEAHAESAPRAPYPQSVFGRTVEADLRIDW